MSAVTAVTAVTFRVDARRIRVTRDTPGPPSFLPMDFETIELVTNVTNLYGLYPMSA